MNRISDKVIISPFNNYFMPTINTLSLAGHFFLQMLVAIKLHYYTRHVFILFYFFSTFVLLLFNTMMHLHFLHLWSSMSSYPYFTHVFHYYYFVLNVTVLYESTPNILNHNISRFGFGLIWPKNALVTTNSPLKDSKPSAKSCCSSSYCTNTAQTT